MVTVVVVQIPRNMVMEGIKLCLDNAERYVKDLELLRQNRSIEHAVVMAIFACEEMAKAYILFEHFKQESDGDFVGVSKKLFEDHEYKMKTAEKVLGINLYLDSSRLPVRIPFRLGAPDVKASPKLRLQCAFVDFRDGSWKFGTEHNPHYFTFLLKAIQDKIDSLRSKL